MDEIQVGQERRRHAERGGHPGREEKIMGCFDMTGGHGYVDSLLEGVRGEDELTLRGVHRAVKIRAIGKI